MGRVRRPSTRELWRTGECTDWADRKRPDVVERVTVAKWTAELLGRPAPPVDWNGGYWDETAAAYGLEVGTTPRAGALVTWDPGVMGAGERTGHVGYVESVGADAFVVSEMHAPERGVVTERRIAARRGRRRRHRVHLLRRTERSRGQRDGPRRPTR